MPRPNNKRDEYYSNQGQQPQTKADETKRLLLKDLPEPPSE